MDRVIASGIELLGVAMAVAIVARRLRLPYTVGLVATGLALALARLPLDLALTHDVLFEVILPPLLFEAALSISWRELNRDLTLVLALSTVGVLVGAGVVAGGLVWALNWPLAPALAFGALIAATDPIAVIAMLSEAGVKGRLRLVIESESLFNDGAAALLFALILPALSQSGAPTPLAIVAQAALIGGGGIVVGVVVGALAIALAGRTDDHLVETALTAVVAYGAFLIAERIGASGVLATVAAGLVMGNLGGLAAETGRFALSAQGRQSVVVFWEFAAFVANSLVFLLIGLAMADAATRGAGFGAGAIAIVVALALAGRAATVYPIALAFAPTRWAFGWRKAHFLWWSGLRGALALALALALPPAAPYRDAILVGAFAVVAFSALVQGLTARWALRALGLDGKREGDAQSS
ncbi:MAG: cation:proton antiporter [Roseiarcus sp.]|jgi:CPA1 family monovalent cation:H+ antiporter